MLGVIKMTDFELLKAVFDFGAPTIICIITIKYLGSRVEKLTDTINECINKMDKRLEKVETAIEHLQRNG